ncbi:PaaI family thioesterase [Bacillus shivajii]|uniref:PaaI family thioesterase n=1 Tax=Bacillus shivajii TaxID=1983719 RepID=UPI001CFB8821|nr:PaaI family thioesterase [Bacillus shivajii]UCZ54300.1 PaaI family thioesterase [Bacillus shivajii]
MSEERLREKFERALQVHNDGTGQQFLYSLLDFNIEYLEEEEKVRITAPVDEVKFNPVGFLHGGIITYIADTAMGHLCAAFGSPSVSLELKTQFFRTANDGEIIAVASFIKKGKTVQFVECDLHDDKNRHLAKVTATFYQLEG